MLTTEESLILKITDKIEDPEERQKALENYILIAKEKPSRYNNIENKIQEKSHPYFLKEILKRIESDGSNKEPTIGDLRREINETKRELRELNYLFY